MKSVVAIFFCTVLVFNLAGYRLLVHYMQAQQAVAFAQKINSGIDESDLISIKVPAALPYYTNSKDFQWTDGEVMIEGVLYQYVQRRIWNDSIEFRCLKNEGKTELLSARDRFFNLAYELQTDSKKSNGAAQPKPLLLEYCAFGKWDIPVQSHAFLSTGFPVDDMAFCASSYTDKPEQPPEAI